MREAEEAAGARGTSERVLMERAGSGLAELVAEQFPRPGWLVLFVGAGHNGGDAFVAARHLRLRGWQLSVRMTCAPERLRPLAREMFESVSGGLSPRWPDSGRLVLLDGLLGIGARGPLRGEVAVAAEEMNALRCGGRAATVAVDLPSGVDADTGAVAPGAVVADLTGTIAAAKAGLLADGAVNHVGRLAVIDVEGLHPDDPGGPLVLTPSVVREFLPKVRNFGMHKGEAGRVGVVAGSRGLTGAARLCSGAAVQGGGGLVTLWAAPEVADILASSVVPEVMVEGTENWGPWERFDALAVGPGLGRHGVERVRELVRECGRPMVVDADALNAFEGRAEELSKCRGPRVLTPHPGEMRRLLRGRWEDWSGLPRLEQAERLAEATGATVLLKGARTVIATAGARPAFNSTGTPGLASGGMGDVLSGLIAALLGQGCSPHGAACAGAWLLGRAAELALQGGESVESLRAGEVARRLGPAFDAARYGRF